LLELDWGKNAAGYGMFKIRGRTEKAHRVAYYCSHGPIPEGLVLDHLCRNRGCVNPSHLEPVTNWENVLRGVNFVAGLARQTHCKRGHEFTPENTATHTVTGCRVCRACVKTRSQRAKARADSGV